MSAAKTIGDGTMRTFDVEGREVQNSIRVLAANVLRIVAGAGKPADVVPQAENFLIAVERFVEKHGHSPIDLVAEAIDHVAPQVTNFQKRDVSDRARLIARGVWGFDTAMHEVVVQSCRLAAAAMLRQKSLENQADNNLTIAIMRADTALDVRNAHLLRSA